MSSKKICAQPEDFNLPLLGIDTHAHLNMTDLIQDFEAVLERAKKCGIAKIGNVFLGSKAYISDKDKFSKHSNIFFILGVHPSDCPLQDNEQLEEIKAIHSIILNDTKIKAIGEIGLDYFYKDIPRQIQKKMLELQLNLAKELNKPIVIHCRDAFEDMFQILIANDFKERPVLWHCFGGNITEAKAIVEQGWIISIPGTVSFKKNEALREAVNWIPENNLVLETDCPFLTPEPHRGKRNEPAFLTLTAHCVANVRNEDPAKLWEHCAKVATNFFGLD